MATSFAPPKEFTYDFTNYDHDAYQKAEDDFVEDTRKFCVENTDSKSKLVGETIQFPMGDGCAVYMVYRTSPLQIIHLPVGDVWHADQCTIRGLRVKDIKLQIERSKAMKKLFS